MTILWDVLSILVICAVALGLFVLLQLRRKRFSKPSKEYVSILTVIYMAQTACIDLRMTKFFKRYTYIIDSSDGDSAAISNCNVMMQALYNKSFPDLGKDVIHSCDISTMAGVYDWFQIRMDAIHALCGLFAHLTGDVYEFKRSSSAIKELEDIIVWLEELQEDHTKILPNDVELEIKNLKKGFIQNC